MTQPCQCENKTVQLSWYQRIPPVILISSMIIIGMSIVVGIFYLNSSIDTCDWVGCFGWCQMDGTDCGIHGAP